MDENRLAKLILDLRIDFSLTQEQLAALVDVSASTVSRWESGELAPSRLHWRRLQRQFRSVVTLPDMESL